MALSRNVLIFHSGALGDFILSWPLAMAFGRVFAQSRVFYVAQRGKGQLAERALRIESVDAEAGWHGLFAEGDPPHLPPAAEKLLAGAHAVASFVAEDPASPWVRNVKALAPHALVVPLAAHPPASFAGHHTDFLLEQLRPSVIWQQAVGQMLASVRQRGLGMTPTPGGPVIVHPGAGSPAKCWPIDWYVELAGRLAAAGREVRFVVGEVEAERWPAEQMDRLGAVGEVRTPSTPSGLMDCLVGAAAFVGNDSGPGHLAGILGLPTVSLFGPTDPLRWKPLGPNVTQLRAEPIEALTVDAVEAAVRQAAGR